MKPQRRIHPGAMVGLAHVLQSGVPSMSAETAVSNAVAIIRGLHQMDLEIGPSAAFGPHEVTSELDGLDMMADMLEKEMGRKGWELH